jgi:hypothetical protein
MFSVILPAYVLVTFKIYSIYILIFLYSRLPLKTVWCKSSLEPLPQSKSHVIIFVPYGKEMNVENSTEMRISRQPSTIQSMVHQKQLANV